MPVGLKRMYTDSFEEPKPPRVSLFSSLGKFKRRRSSEAPSFSSESSFAAAQPTQRITLAARISNALSGKLQPRALLNPVPKGQADGANTSRSRSLMNSADVSLSPMSQSFSQSFSGESSLNQKGFAIVGNRSLGVNAHKSKQGSADVLLLKMALLQNYRNDIAQREKQLTDTFDKQSEKELAERRKKLELEEQEESEEEPLVLTDEQKSLVNRHFSAARRNPHAVVVDAFKIELTYADLTTLQPPRWLNDNVIDLYLNSVAAENPNVAVFTTHFFSRLEESGYSAVRRWALRKKLDVFAPDYVFVPVNQGSMHWTLTVINNKDSRLEFYDSLPSGKGKRELDLVLTYMKEEAKRLGKPSIPNYTLVPNAEGPTQSNGSDCGVFVCETVTRLARGQSLNYKQRDMPFVRDRIAYSLLQLSGTTGSKL